MKVLFGADHAGFEMKSIIVPLLQAAGHEVIDAGTTSSESCDYPDFAEKVCEGITLGKAERGILFCTTGIGMSIAANRFPAVRAALCLDADCALRSRSHNDANVLVIAVAYTKADAIKDIIEKWLAAPYSADVERHARRVAKLERMGNRITEVDAVRAEDPEIFNAIMEQTEQEDTTINLIASENTTTRAVREAQGSVLTNKYAEGYPKKRWYGGCNAADDVERIAKERAMELFGAEHANVQPHCGSSANMAVYFAMLNVGDTILSMSLDQGGHLSHGSPVNFSGKLYNIVPYMVDPETELLDYDQIERQAMEVRPKLIVAGASAYPRLIDFERFRAIADKCGALLMVDMAHIAGLIAGGVHPSPVPYADFVTTTTHKTLRGPRGGMTMCKAQYAAAIDKAVFPGMQGGPLVHTIAAKAVCFREWLKPEGGVYARQVVRNCKKLADVIMGRGFRLVSGGTDNHLMLVDVARSGLTGKLCSAALEQAGIIANKNTIPFDKNSPFVTSGIRIGTASATTRGMKEEEMAKIGNWIADVFSAPEDAERLAKIREEVRDFAVRYPVP